MKTMMSILLSLVATMSLQAIGETVSDETLKDEIRRFLRPVECVEMIRGQPRRPPVLTEKISFDGDTNRLARILVEVAQTNNAWYSEMAMRELVKYGSAEQLPFLYSCATNPAIGDLAVKAVLRIEGVTSNSIAIARSYLLSSNEFSRAKQHDRSLVCEELLKSAFELPELSEYRPLCLSVAREFARNVNTMHISMDDAIVANDPSYRYSKRRLAVMRSAQYRCVNPGLYTYVTNAINELVSYPESDLPD